MDWTNAITDLRTLLSDGPTDRHRYRKKCFGEINGTNKNFKTFEFRRVTNLTTSSFPLGVYVDGVLGTASLDSPDTGDFQLATAPLDGSVVEASYYIQWFTDAELNTLLRVATEWLGLNTDPAKVPPGLQPSALRYSAGEAYLKMAMRWREHLSEMYRVEDAPEKENGTVKSFLEMADKFKEDARKMRDDYYTRQGQSLAPSYGFAIGAVRDPQPRR